MDYKVYLENETDISKMMYDLIFYHCDNGEDQKIFDLCVEFAEKLSKHDNTECYNIAEVMEIIPAQYVFAILLFAKKENANFTRNADMIEKDLQFKYYKQFQNYFKENKTEKLVKLTQTDYKKCLNLERRMFDLTEIMYIMQYLNFDPLDIEFKKAETEELKQLKQLKELCFKDVYFKKYRKFLKAKFEDLIQEAENKLDALNVTI